MYLLHHSASKKKISKNIKSMNAQEYSFLFKEILSSAKTKLYLIFKLHKPYFWKCFMKDGKLGKATEVWLYEHRMHTVCLPGGGKVEALYVSQHPHRNSPLVTASRAQPHPVAPPPITRISNSDMFRKVSIWASLEGGSLLTGSETYSAAST